MKYVKMGAVLLCLTLFLTQCKVAIKPLPSVLEEIERKKAKSSSDPDVVFKFFEEDFVAGGYEWHYPDESKVYIDEEVSYKGDVSICMDLNANDYSGGSVVLFSLTYDLQPYYERGALEFWIKSSVGREKCFVSLLDDEKSDGLLTNVKLNMEKYVTLSGDWAKVSIPLADFGTRGKYWDEKKQLEVNNPFTWNKVHGFQISIEKGANPQFKIWVDNVFVKQDVFDSKGSGKEIYFDDIEETVPTPPIADKPDVEPIHTLFKDAVKNGGYTAVYGKKSAYKVQPSDASENAGVLVGYLDNNDYSGMQYNIGESNSVDLEEIRKNNGGIAFWARFGEGINSVSLGISDGKKDGKMVQTNVVLADYKELSTEWQYFMIPLKAFSSTGNWWDEDKAMEVPGKMDWKNIVQVAFVTDKFGNRIEEHKPVSVYVDDITIIKSIPGYVDPDVYWNNFTSNEPELKLINFEDGKEHLWEKIAGEESELQFLVVDQEKRELRESYGRKVAKVVYSNNDWCYVGFSFHKNSSENKMRDWSKHYSLAFDFYTEQDEEDLKIHINDSGNEAFYYACQLVKGWNRVVIPLRDFRKYPYHQESDAIVNNKLDLESVHGITFWPNKGGKSGEFMIDNIRMTNDKK